MSPAPWQVLASSDGFVVAADDGRVLGRELLASDARLIASAPKMYELLREFVDCELNGTRTAAIALFARVDGDGK